jgi:hypothetical protein
MRGRTGGGKEAPSSVAGCLYYELEHVGGMDSGVVGGEGEDEGWGKGGRGREGGGRGEWEAR